MARLAPALLALLMTGAACSAPMQTLRDATVAAKPGSGDFLAQSYYHYLLALEAERVGNLEEALLHLNEAMVLDTNSHQVLTRAARVLEQLGRRDEAKIRAEHALTLAPDYVPALLQLARIQTYSAEYAKAQKAYQRALELAPEKQTIYLELARLYRRDGELEAALDTLEAYSNRYPRSSIQHMSLTAILEHELGMPEAAEETYLHLMSTYPWVEQARRELIELLLSNGGPEYAAERLETLYKEEPWQDWIPAALVDLYTQLGNIPELLAHLETLEARSSENADLRYRAARTLTNRGEHAYAEAVIVEALDAPGSDGNQARFLYGHIAVGKEDYAEGATRFAQIDSNSDLYEDALIMRAMCLKLSGDLDGAVAEIGDYMAKNPGAVEVQYALGTILQDASAYEEAIAVFDGLLEADPTHISAIAQRAACIESLGHTKEAISALKVALDEMPGETELLWVLAAIYSDAGQLDEAVWALQEALRHNSDDFQLRFQLATVLDSAGRKEEAISQMKVLLERHPNHPEVLNFIGYTYAEMGIRLPEAEIMIRKALESDPNNGYMLDSLGWVFYKQTEYEKAVITLEKAVVLSGQEAVIVEHLADAYLKVEREGEAMATLIQALHILSFHEDSNPDDQLRLQEKVDALKNDGVEPSPPPWLKP